MANVDIWTDGSCRPNPGPGGWAAILIARMNGKTHTKELSGGKSSTTVNEMELLAVEEGLKALHGQGHRVTIYTDSQLVVGYMAWGWRCKEPRLREIVGRIAARTSLGRHKVTYVKVAGHSSKRYNERADAMAKAAVPMAAAWTKDKA
jgi:ribonuclease HI